MKKENIIVAFYVLYFGWLFTVAFLTPSLDILNIFTSIITILYFIFLKEKWDLVWFWVAALAPIAIGTVTFANWQFKFESGLLPYIPMWLPLAWGTTIVALRKFFILITR